MTAGTGSVLLTSGAGITENGGATITAASLGMNAAGAINVNDANTVGTLAAKTTVGGITYQNDNTALTIGTIAAGTNFAATSGLDSSTAPGTIDLKTGTGGLTISNHVTAGTGSVLLTSGAGITENGGATITAASLGMNAAGAINVNDANTVGTLAAKTKQVGRKLSFVPISNSTPETLGLCLDF